MSRELESLLDRMHALRCNDEHGIPRAATVRVRRVAKQMLRLKDYLSAVPEEKSRE